MYVFIIILSHSQKQLLGMTSFFTKSMRLYHKCMDLSVDDNNKAINEKKVILLVLLLGIIVLLLLLMLLLLLL